MGCMRTLLTNCMCIKLRPDQSKVFKNRVHDIDLTDSK